MTWDLFNFIQARLMSLKNFILLMGGFVAVGIFMMKNYPDYSFDFFAILLLLAGVAEICRMFYHRSKNAAASIDKSRFKETHDDDGNVYHNDFSKVPAGLPQEGELPLKPRVMLIGDPYRAIEANFKEDMERLGLNYEEPEESLKNKKIDI